MTWFLLLLLGWSLAALPSALWMGRYLRGLQRAEDALESDLPRYLHLWKNAVPPEFADHDWDFSKFTRGEKFVNQPIPRDEFEEVFRQVERWGLDQHLGERSYDRLAYDMGLA